MAAQHETSQSTTIILSLFRWKFQQLLVVLFAFLQFGINLVFIDLKTGARRLTFM